MYGLDFERAVGLLTFGELEEAIKNCPLLDDMKYTYLHRREMARIAGELGIDWNQYRFHDCDKMVMMLFHTDEDLTKEHRSTQPHHHHNTTDMKALVEMMLDWESARFTKPDKPLNALGTLNVWYSRMKDRMMPVLEEYGLAEKVISEAISQEDFEKKMESVSTQDLVFDIADFLLFKEENRVTEDLCHAIEEGFCLSSIWCLVDAGAKVDGLDETDNPLCVACGCGRIDVVKLLLQKGADINGGGFCQPIHKACGYGSGELVDYLLKKGATLDNRCLSFAVNAHIGRLFMVKKLLGMGLDVNAVNKFKETPLYQAARNGDNLDIVKFLVESGADVNCKCQYNCTPLWVATLNRNEKVAEYLKSVGGKMYDKNGAETDNLYDFA